MTRARTVRFLLVPLLAAVALFAATGALAQTPPDGADVELRVWQGVADPSRLYLSARPAGGPWGERAPLPVALDSLSASGAWRYGDASIEARLAVGPAVVEARVWQSVADPSRLYLSARPSGGSWRALGTVPLALDGLSRSGAYRHGAVTLAAGVTPLRIALLYEMDDEQDRGNERRRSFDLALRHVNAAGGVFGRPVEAVYADTDNDTDAAVAAARRLIEVDGVHAIVGPDTSAISIAIVEQVTAAAGVPVIAASATSPLLTALDDDDFFFRTALSDAALGPVLARVARERGYGNLGVLVRDDAWGRGLRDAFAAAWTGPAAIVTFPAGQTAFLDDLRESARDGAEALLLFTFYGEKRAILREALDSGLYDQFLFAEGKTLGLVEAVGAEALADMYGVAQHAPPADASTEAWDAAWQAAGYGDPPLDIYVRGYYDAAVAIALAAEAAGGLDGAAIRDRLRAVAGPPGEDTLAGPEGVAAALGLLRAGAQVDYHGAVNEIEWDANGDLRGGYVGVWRFTPDGRIEDVEIAPVGE